MEDSFQNPASGIQAEFRSHLDDGSNDGNLDQSSTSEQEKWLLDWVSQNPEEHERLITKSRPQSVILGTGEEILTSACQFILDHVVQELIFVTCFWTESASLVQICNLLEGLSQKALAAQRILRVRITVSSLSLSQKLLHTRSAAGRTYRSSEWESTLGIPSSLNLSGLDLQIKSVFVLPFSVFHSKFIVIDDKACLVPSCNVSWETWLEGCIDLRGPIVEQFRTYWRQTWETSHPIFTLPRPDDLETSIGGEPIVTSLSGSSQLPQQEARTVFLPSRYHANPQFQILPCQKPASFPRTPLNTFTIQLLESAKKEIFLQTPNTTSPPVLQALFRALERGVSVQIVTNERLMRIEQLVTAGTTTPWCLAKLLRSCRELKSQSHESRGRLRVDYFVPSQKWPESMRSSPVSSHIKMTVVDNEVVLFGSGNMDRASWYTSQEVGVAIISPIVARNIRERLSEASRDHTKAHIVC